MSEQDKTRNDDYPVNDDLLKKFSQAENWLDNNEPSEVQLESQPSEESQTGTEAVDEKNRAIAEKISSLLDNANGVDAGKSSDDKKAENEGLSLETEQAVSAQKTIILSHKQTIEDVVTLRNTLLSALDREGDIEIDASAVMTIDTATLQLLLACKQTASQAGKELAIEFPSERFIRAVELSGMKEALNVDQAFAGFF